MSGTYLAIGKLPGDLLADLLSAHPIDDPSVIVGPGVGMDAAAVDVGDDLLVVKSDPITFAKDRAPLYLVNVNANDLACMGATPRWMLVTALLPEGKTDEPLVRQLFEELNDACRNRGISLIGGHTEITGGLDRPILIGNLLGTVSPGKLLKPGGARPGDRILISRPVAIEGTALLACDAREQLEPFVGTELLDRAEAFLDDPSISVRYDAIALHSTGAVTALHDPTEGGLATGVRELAMSAKLGAVISRSNVPIMPETAAIADALGLDPLGMLASGSLLATVPPDKMDIVEQVCSEQDIPFAWIGKITPPERGIILREGTREVDLPAFSTDEVARALVELKELGTR
ncbi:MAG: AIR synthase family protein [Thermomicrobiales bacterium]|nr:AIR synthase family protein [Thermomicrobiales bacterium]